MHQWAQCHKTFLRVSYTFGPAFQTRCQSFKTFYSRNLRMFVISYLFVPAEPFQPSLMFADKAVAYPGVERLV
jgi:hypothetical protein